MFDYAPDTKVIHAVRFDSGNWAFDMGYMTGNFTKPMITPDYKTIQPTGKSFNITTCTIEHFVNGLMDEGYLFWNNQEFDKQIGLAS